MIEKLQKLFSNFDFKLTLLRVSIGIIYIWFGGLKFFSSLSPAETIAKETIDFLTFNLLPSEIGYFILAVWEIAIGILLVLNFSSRLAIGLALIHMVFTFTPFFAFSSLSFERPPYVFTLLGQYIFKNIIIICALIMIFPAKKTQKKLT